MNERTNERKTHERYCSVRLQTNERTILSCVGKRSNARSNRAWENERFGFENILLVSCSAGLCRRENKDFIYKNLHRVYAFHYLLYNYFNLSILVGFCLT